MFSALTVTLTLALGVAGLAPGVTRAQAGRETLSVVLADDAASLDALVAPGGTPVPICSGSACPSPLTRVDAENVDVGADDRRVTVDARVRVTADLPLVGERNTTVTVHCAGEPEVDGAGVIHLRSVTCDAGSVPGVSSALGALLARNLEGRTIDLLHEVRGGALATHSTDQRLSRACAPACVVSTTLLQPLESDGHPHVVVRVEVEPASCCP